MYSVLLNLIPLPLSLSPPFPETRVLLIFRNRPGAVHRQEPRPDPEEEEETEHDHDLPATETQSLLDEMASSTSKESSFKLSTGGEHYRSLN